jgi:hypothetical protein
MFSHEAEVGVKWTVKRGCCESHAMRGNICSINYAAVH